MELRCLNKNSYIVNAFGARRTRRERFVRWNHLKWSFYAFFYRRWSSSCKNYSFISVLCQWATQYFLQAFTRGAAFLLLARCVFRCERWSRVLSWRLHVVDGRRNFHWSLWRVVLLWRRVGSSCRTWHMSIRSARCLIKTSQLRNHCKCYTQEL